MLISRQQLTPPCDQWLFQDEQRVENEDRPMPMEAEMVVVAVLEDAA